MPPGHKRGSRRASPPPEPVTALRAYAIKLLDNGDGHGTDWPKAAAALFKAAFSCLDETKGDARALTIARRVHDGAYNRMAGSPDSETPYTAEMQEAPPLMPDSGPHPDLELNR